MITHEFDLDIVPGGPKVELRLNQYDSDFVLRIHLIARTGTLSILPGTTAQIRGVKPDGNVYSADVHVDPDNNMVTVPGNVQITAASGRAVFEICLTQEEKELNTANFIINIERAPMDKDAVTSDSVVRELINVMDDLEEIVANAEAAETNALDAEAWAVGQRDGEDVPSTDEAYHNNAKYYAQQAADTYDSLGLSVVDGALCYTYITE